ncbi:malate dehydrogenase (quinone) [Mycobacterium sp.]|uniref:malate dehydrogenase (quinone) n=1 Tax=Mycobacterium sp. TaxID=1785 RepID=UPI003A85AEE3
MSDSPPAKTDVVLIGAGIMSATLGALLRRLEPDWSMVVVERLDTVGAESSSPWNNAGTGHAGLCELNYTPQRPDGSIDIAKAVDINEQFHLTRQFWAYAAQNGILADVRSFLNPVPHASFVRGADGVDYLRRRRAALAGNPHFAATELIESPDEFARRLPLMAAGRGFAEPIGLNWSDEGTDVDFGALSRQLIGFCAGTGTAVLFGHEVRRLDRGSDGRWVLTTVDRRTGHKRTLRAEFVFAGAGGHTLPLLQRSGIPEIRGFGGFPIGGRFLRSAEPRLTGAHRAKVYGAPSPGAPPLGALHLDLRYVDGQPWLVFGPYAGWSPKFLKHGKATDLARSIRAGNLMPVLGVGVGEIALVGYLLGQLRLTGAGRIRNLREFVPCAMASDWELTVAGQRVQVIRPGRGSGSGRGGVLEFGTSIVGAADGSIAGLLGGSPGASTAVPAMLAVLERCFPERYRRWLPMLREMMPSLGVQLSSEPALYEEVRSWTARALGLDAAGGGRASGRGASRRPDGPAH